MIKTVPFDIPASFIIGMVIPVVCPGAVRSAGRAGRGRLFMAAMLFELFFFVPLGAYLYFFHPDWSLMYYLDPAGMAENTVMTIGAAALAAYMLAAAGGFLIAEKLVREGNWNTAAIVLLAVLAALSVYSAVSIERLMQVGTYAEWAEVPRQTAFLWSHRIGYVIGFVGAVSGVILLLLVREIRKTARAG